MRKVRIYDQACNQIAGFQKMGDHFLRKLVIDGRSRSTHENYLRQMAKLALHFRKTPLELTTNDLEEYLYLLIQTDSSSLSSFKHLIYGLRKLYLLYDKEVLHVGLPEISRPKKLPVVLSKSEIRSILMSPDNIRDRVMFALTYDAGLRISELLNLLISDVDSERKQVHVRQSKYKKDRYVTISDHTVRGFRKHIALNSPKDYVFECSNRKGIPISKTRVRILFQEAVKKAGIRKNVCVHTLRHSYATHQLEDGQNIMAVKQALGHSGIEATMVYLHIANTGSQSSFGCLDHLYNNQTQHAK